jgi:hypothetical protein
VLAPTRWKLRAAIRVVNQALAELKVQQHPDKTFVGWIAAGFEFLGFRYNSAGLAGVAKATSEKFAARINQLYEQGADAIHIGQYVRRWLRCSSSGLGPFNLRVIACSGAGANVRRQALPSLRSRE